MPGCPHLVLSDIRDNNGFIIRFSAYRFQDTCWIRILLVALNARATLVVFSFPTAHFIQPCTMVSRLDCLDKSHQGFLSICHNRHSSTFDLMHFRGIDIDVNEAGMWSKLAHLAGNTIVETQSDTDNQVGYSNSSIDMRRAMHPGHS